MRRWLCWYSEDEWRGGGKGCTRFVDSVVSCCVCLSVVHKGRARDANCNDASLCLKRDCEGISRRAMVGEEGTRDNSSHGGKERWSSCMDDEIDEVVPTTLCECTATRSCKSNEPLKFMTRRDSILCPHDIDSSNRLRITCGAGNKELAQLTSTLH